MSSSTLGPISTTAFNSISTWVDASAPLDSQFDFISYLSSNFPNAPRSESTVREISEYISIIREIADAEDALLNLRSDLARPKMMLEKYNIQPTEASYADIEKRALEKSVERTEAALRMFEDTHLTLRLRRAKLETNILAAEAPQVKERALLVPTQENLNPPPQTQSLFMTIVANVNASKRSRPASSLLSYSPHPNAHLSEAQDLSRNRAPSLSHSESTAHSSHPPRTPHNSPPTTPSRHGKARSGK